ncbi:MAG: serine hydrolase domain-containing protein [Devosiaceae bacterium]
MVAAEKTAERDLSRRLPAFLAAEEIAGGVVLISGPKGRFVITAGISDRQSEEAVHEHTRFYAASTGKMFIAAGILSALDDGQIALDDPISPFLATINGAHQMDRAGPVTIRQLLDHSSGLPEYLTDGFAEASWNDPVRRWAVSDALAFAYYDRAIPAGEVPEYTNTNYLILGHILASLDGSLEQSLQARVFDPAGMASTTLGAPNDPGPNFARGYDEDGRDVSAFGWNSILGDGPAITTVGDLEAFARALFGSEIILSTHARNAMIAPSALDPYYGLGTSVEEDQLGTWYGHSGGYDGFEADLRYYPDHDLVLAYMVNGNQVSDVSFLDIAASWYARQ